MIFFPPSRRNQKYRIVYCDKALGYQGSTSATISSRQPPPWQISRLPPTLCQQRTTSTPKSGPSYRGWAASSCKITCPLVTQRGSLSNWLPVSISYLIFPTYNQAPSQTPDTTYTYTHTHEYTYATYMHNEYMHICMHANTHRQTHWICAHTHTPQSLWILLLPPSDIHPLHSSLAEHMQGATAPCLSLSLSLSHTHTIHTHDITTQQAHITNLKVITQLCTHTHTHTHKPHENFLSLTHIHTLTRTYKHNIYTHTTQPPSHPTGTHWQTKSESLEAAEYDSSVSGTSCNVTSARVKSHHIPSHIHTHTHKQTHIHTWTILELHTTHLFMLNTHTGSCS